MSRRSCCGAEHVTPRQQELLVLVARGFTNGQVATRMHLSEKTAARMVSDLLVLTGAHNRSELVALACHCGLLNVKRWPPTRGRTTCLGDIQVR